VGRYRRKSDSAPPGLVGTLEKAARRSPNGEAKGRRHRRGSTFRATTGVVASGTTT
jgi:hypothetical protein